MKGCCGVHRARVIRWGRSSAWRATALQAVGRRFDPVRLHHLRCVGVVRGYGRLLKGYGLVAQLVRARA